MLTTHSNVARRCTPVVAVLAALVLAGTADAAAEAVTGPDISSWQHTNGTVIDWAKVKAAGQTFAMVKATEGLSYLNPYLLPDALQMRAAGVAAGAYHYADVTQSAAAQAVFYAAAAGATLGQNKNMNLPPVIDFEDAKGLSPTQLSAWLNEYLTTVQSLTGVKPIIYTYPRFWRTAMANTTAFSDYPLWIADYNGSGAPTTPLPGGWTTWTFWQYTNSATVPGVQGMVDLNRYNNAQGPFGGYLTPAASTPSTPAGNAASPTSQVTGLPAADPSTAVPDAPSTPTS